MIQPCQIAVQVGKKNSVFVILTAVLHHEKHVHLIREPTGLTLRIAVQNLIANVTTVRNIYSKQILQNLVISMGHSRVLIFSKFFIVVYFPIPFLILMLSILLKFFVAQCKDEGSLSCVEGKHLVRTVVNECCSTTVCECNACSQPEPCQQGWQASDITTECGCIQRTCIPEEVCTYEGEKHSPGKTYLLLMHWNIARSTKLSLY